MHRFQSKSTIIRFRFAALLLCLKCLLVPAAAVILIDSIIRTDLTLTYIALGLGGFTLLVAIVQCVVAARTRCPLCMTPVLATRGCAKHRSARTVLGSYRLRVALGVLLRGSFTCPYCHERSAMEVRSKRPDSKSRRY